MKKYLSDADLPNIYAQINEAIYGIIDGSIENMTNSKATYIRDYAFYKHPSLISATFLNAKEIGDYAFYQCPSLTSVNISSATKIGIFAFKECKNLNSINFPNVTTVENGIFDECTNLSEIHLDSLEQVPALMFRKCTALTHIDLPNVTNIGTQAFYDSGITSLTLRANTVCSLENENAFYFTPIENGTGYIYVPANLVNSYKTANGWSTYSNQIRAIA